MINVTIESPSKAILEVPDGDLKALVDCTIYKNKSIEFQYSRHLKNKRWRNSDPKAWKAHGDNLNAQIRKTLLFKEDGKLCIKPGFIPYLSETLKLNVVNNIKYPKARPYPWYRAVKLTPYLYQSISVEKLIEAKHGNVELCTGSGKSLIIMMLTQKLGLKTIVVTPSDSIFREMLERFETHFGKNMIGALGGGKRRLGKPIMVCISNSLANLKEGTKEYKEMSEYEVLIADESHTIPAATLEKMCHGVLKDIPYRFFLSGTQTRNDGTEKLLHSIIGKTVHSLSTKEAIDGGYICDHEFRIVKVLTSNPGFESSDAIEMKRMHFLRNDNIAKFIGMLANSAYNSKGEQTLVLVDEIDQIHNLIKYLTIPYICATGDKTFDDPTEAVEKFNKGEAKVLIGTSCISTGTNIYPTHHTVNWQGGTSEIKTKQGAVGRSVRRLESSQYHERHKPKKKAIIWDFDVQHVDIMSRHLKQRIEIYGDSGTPIIRL
jgi:superfamily II DNA or RNA helicase